MTWTLLQPIPTNVWFSISFSGTALFRRARTCTNVVSFLLKISKFETFLWSHDETTQSLLLTQAITIWKLCCDTFSIWTESQKNVFGGATFCGLQQVIWRRSVWVTQYENNGLVGIFSWTLASFQMKIEMFFVVKYSTITINFLNGLSNSSASVGRITAFELSTQR